MKKRWEEPAMETLDVQATEYDTAGDLEPDGLYESRQNPVPAGWGKDCCS